MNKQITKKELALSQPKGFTLLELLIVISIIAILSVILIVALNPAETLKKARDTQRLSDLSSIKTAIGIYITSDSSVNLDGEDDGSTGNELCYNGSGTDTVWYSVDDTTLITDSTIDGGSTDVPNASNVVATAAELGEVDGTGWLPVDLASLTGGSPISNMPIDPTNTIGSFTAVDNEDLVYRYTCDSNDVTFELNAVLESTAFANGGSEDKETTDGGNNTAYYEVGTKLDILGTGTDI